MPPKLPSAFASGIVRHPSQLTRHRVSPWTCSRCQTLSLLHPRRAFTTTPPLPKKSSGGKQAPKRTNPLNPAKTTTLIDPLDFAVFEADIKHTLDSLKHDLSKIRAGGLDAEKIENVRVKLGAGGRGQVVRVEDVAQVVQRGRVMVVMVGDDEVRLFIALLHPFPLRERASFVPAKNGDSS